jgi:hypothetical protein
MGATINKHTSMLMTLPVNRAAALSVTRKCRNIAADYSRMREELAQICSPANSDRDALRNSLVRASRITIRKKSAVVEEKNTGCSLVTIAAEFGNFVLGVFTPVLAKHSKSFSLIDCISVGVDRMQRKLRAHAKASGGLAEERIDGCHRQGGDLRGVRRGQTRSSQTPARTVHDLYFEPKFEEFRSRTIWSPPCVYVGIQGTRPHSTIQGFGKAGRVHGDPLFTIVLDYGTVDAVRIQIGLRDWRNEL